MSNIFIVAAKRTPFGAFGGSLKSLSATELGAIATKAALTSANIDPSAIGAIYFGNVIQSSSDAAYLARHVGLKCGVPIPIPALTINRLCGSGFETVIQGAKSIKLGEAKVVVCGGSENMSMAPLQVDGNDARWGVSLGSGLKMRDSLWDGLTDQYLGTPMGVTAENLAEKYGITRQVGCSYLLLFGKVFRIIFDTYLIDYLLLAQRISSRNATNMLFEVRRLGQKLTKTESLIWRSPK